MPVPPVVLGVALVLGGGVLAASVLEVPQNWFRAEEDRVYDIAVAVGVDYRPLSGEWTLSQPEAAISPSKWLSVGAIVANSLSFSLASEDQKVIFQLLDPVSLSPLAVRTDNTGESGYLDVFEGAREVDVVFREIPVATYTLSVHIEDGDGNRVAERRYPLPMQNTGGE